MSQYRVQVFAVGRDAVLGPKGLQSPAPVEQEGFVVEAPFGPDQAKQMVKDQLIATGHAVRAVSFAQGGGLLAYVFAPRS